MPFVFFGGTGLIGNNPGGQLPQIGNTFQFADNYSRIVGNHSFKIGGDGRKVRVAKRSGVEING